MINNDKYHMTSLKDEYYSIEETAKLLKVAYLTVYRWIQSNKLKAYKAGKQYRISILEINKFIKNE
jgi:excisionase family DNA binding protein